MENLPQDYNPTPAPPDDAPTPESRRYGRCDGPTVRLADGRDWRLPAAPLRPVLDGVRDRLYDSLVLSGGKVALADIREGAWSLLVLGYDLAGGEVAGLLHGADEAALVQAVLDALIGPAAVRRTYSAWARSALVANGLDPATMPVAELPHVLAQLVHTGRAIPPGLYLESGEAAAKRAAILDDTEEEVPC